MHLALYIRNLGRLAKALFNSFTRMGTCLFFLLFLSSFSIMSVAQENESEQDNAITEEVRSILTEVRRNGAFLDSDEAFRLSIATHSDGSLIGLFWIANGYYLYRDKIAFTKIDGNVTIESYSLPLSLIHI